ncbi:MAG: hypothetical protein M1820_002277 [Bogoriella megaspora]|nr:MAG: hypothetical protein M1820_002277 [Bogoriella megaspora]
MNSRQSSNTNDARAYAAAEGRKRDMEDAFPMQEVASAKRQQTIAPGSAKGDLPFQRLMATLDRSQAQLVAKSSISSLDSSKRSAADARPATVDWKQLFCNLVGANSDLEDKTILEATSERLQRFNEAYPSSEDSRSASPVRVTPIYRVFHRVRCGISEYHTPIDVDPPFVSDTGHLVSKSRIKNLDVHIAENPGISFIVFQEYRCCTKQSRKLEPEVDSIPSEETIWLISPLLVEALRVALKDFSGIVPSALIEEKHEIRNPHTWMFHLRTSLPSKEVEQPDETLSRHLEIFFRYFYEGKKNEFDLVQDMLSNGKISRQYVEYLFVPGTIVLNNGDSRGILSQRLYRIQDWPKVSYEWKRSGTQKRDVQNSKAHFEAKTLQWEFNGNFYKQISDRRITFEAKDDDPIEIQQLPFIPVEFLPDHQKEFIIARGRKFWACRHPKYVSYFGRALDSGQNENFCGARFMVDFWSWRKACPQSNIGNSTMVSELSEHDLRRDDPPKDDFVLLLPLRVPAFHFRDKVWILKEDTKTLVKALVMNMIEPADATDLISGKGNGLVMLLHGGPGTGKTLTAESVAEYARKPLYRVTCGDIGTSPAGVEQLLKNVLEMGKKWDCVVLLDEAEVFLQERSLVDVNRNALVSVFLRVLEYHEGILILTSNRVGSFDEGFKSRIQLAIHYDMLGLSSRRQVWRNFIDRLASSQHEDIDIDNLERHINDLAKYILNGREIRNALTTGRQLARYEKKPLTFQVIKHAIEVSSRFDKYLKDVNDGLDDEQIARDGCLR